MAVVRALFIELSALLARIRRAPFGKLGTQWGAVIVTPRPDTDRVTNHDTAPTVVAQAYAFALDPTPEQISALRSHVGGSRFAYNALLGLVQANWDENRTK